MKYFGSFWSFENKIFKFPKIIIFFLHLKNTEVKLFFLVKLEFFEKIQKIKIKLTIVKE